MTFVRNDLCEINRRRAAPIPLSSHFVCSALAATSSLLRSALILQKYYHVFEAGKSTRQSRRENDGKQ
jgi:hypothetical protein